MARRKPKRVLRFRVALAGIDLEIWRLVDVPETYTFWDLHVAIQDAMGWLDYHLHRFDVRRKGSRRPVAIGIPDDEFPEEKVLAGWELKVADYFREVGETARYEYDFGDGWSHQLTLVGILLADSSLEYPVCVDGARACPPEDCGGVSGYEDLLEILKRPDHDEYEGMVEWLKGHARSYWPYRPDAFDPKAVKFDNPKSRFNRAFR